MEASVWFIWYRFRLILLHHQIVGFITISARMICTESVQIMRVQQGILVYQESQTFDRKAAAQA